MALEFSTTSRTGYGTGMLWKEGQDSLFREIPACYTDEIEHWVFEESRWMSYGWDVSSEEENALSRGELPPGAFVHSPPVNPKPVYIQPEAQTTAQDASRFTDPMDLNLIVDAIESSSLMKMDATGIPLLDDSKAYDALPDPRADPRRYLDEFYSPPRRAGASLPAPSYTPSMNQMASPHLYMRTPTLSPSGSSSSSDDSDWDSELSSAVSRASSAEPGLANACGLDLQFFAQPLPAGHPLPTLFFPSVPSPMVMPQNPVAGPSTAPGLVYGTPMAQSQAREPGPSRTSRKKRNDKPCRRAKSACKESAMKAKVNSNDDRGMNEQICAVCGYVQARGAGDMRSFKRHLETHPQYKTIEWRCRGILQLDGTYYGGCNKLFARRDSLIRHIKTAQTDCISDLIPCELSHGAESFET